MGMSLLEHFFETILEQAFEKQLWKGYVVSSVNFLIKLKISIPILSTVQELSSSQLEPYY